LEKGVTIPIDSIEFSLAWMTPGLQRSILGPCLNGQPVLILMAKLTETANTMIGISRRTAVMMRGFDFIFGFLFILVQQFMCQYPINDKKYNIIN
jgi:hypothetical protein